MKGGVANYLVGAGVLLVLVGCGRSIFTGERAPWRHQAEVECMKSGTVRLGAGVTRIEPIEGPGMCGADFPLKVAVLGEGGAAMSYGDDLRPPGSIPNASQMPNWPINEPRYSPPAPIGRVDVQPMPSQAGQPHMRWVPGPPPAQRAAPMGSAGRPVELSPTGAAPGVTPSAAPLPDDIPDDAVLPNRDYPPQRAQPAPVYQPSQRAAPVYQPSQRNAPALGPARAPQMSAASPATLTPAATLACPLVSALDRWMSDGVQPAAMRWFGSQVIEIKQISSYSCRGMVGSGGSGISEHAFGNALDIAAFTFADGRRVTVQEGWHGTPEEQGFLRDVHLAACDNFNTVLAPGYNAAHYNHIHVDLMRRASGDRPCRPEAMTGEMAAAKARALYAKHRGPAYTGSVPTKASRARAAVPGEDGYILDLDEATGSILPEEQSSRRPRSAKSAADRLTAH